MCGAARCTSEWNEAATAEGQSYVNAYGLLHSIYLKSFLL
jgi:hypothetical protein